MRGCGGAGEIAIAMLNRAFHRCFVNFTPPHRQQGTNDRTNHVAQEAIRGNGEFNEVATSSTIPAIRDIKGDHLAHARLYIRLGGRESGPIMLADEQRTTPAHSIQIERPRFLVSITSPERRYH